MSFLRETPNILKGHYYTKTSIEAARIKEGILHFIHKKS